VIYRAITRYFRLREVACELGIAPRWWWRNARLLQELFDERVRREIIARSLEKSFPKKEKILDFRSYHNGVPSSAAPRK
jgi:hypothetical protein